MTSFRTFLAAVALAAAAPASAQISSGAYLAARQAGFENDFRAAADYFSDALRRDRDNTQLLDKALTALVSLGEVDRGEALARRLREAGIDNQITNLTLYAAQVERGEWEGVLADLDVPHKVGPLYDGLLRAWALVGAGRMQGALEAFDKVAENSATASFGLYHKALALASAGDFEGAAEVFASPGAEGLASTRRGLLAKVQILSQLDRDDEAAALIEDALGGETDRALSGLLVPLAAAQTLPFDIVQSPTDGAAELHYTIATAVSGEAADAYTLLYSRLVGYLRPDHVDGLLLTANLLERLGRYELATETYDKVPRDHPAFYIAEMGRAQALHVSEREDAAIEVLTQLGRTESDLPVVHVALGDLLRGLERFPEATEAYDRAVNLIEEPDPSHWSLYFSRGITLERSDRWEEAEADFRRALDLQPDQPQVLNYLGYSYVEKGENMDEALDMIERAVAIRPNSGYIVDSLAWALYKLGRYDEAIGPMERAVELEAVDPIINDHLGDVLWAVGRTREAEFQWRRALSFDPEPEDAERIRRKLKVGLDAVLAEEGADAPDLANDG